MDDDANLALRDLLATMWIPHALRAAVELRLPDAIARGERVEGVAVDRLVRALATIDVVRVGADGRLTLTAVGELLRTDTADSQHRRVLLQAGAGSQQAWGALTERVRAGHPGDSFPTHDDAFDAAMADGCTHLRDAIAAAHDFTGVRSVVDVGGGWGALLPAILRTDPAMNGIVFDLPHCKAGAEALIEREGLTDRYSFVGGDLFVDPLPVGADAYVLKNVVHDWDDDRSVAIFRRCRDAMTPTSRLLVVEVVVPEQLGAEVAHRRIAFADLHMLVANGGGERTTSRYAELLADADLELTSVTPTATPAALAVIEARPHV